MHSFRTGLCTLIISALTTPVIAADVNVYSYRQPELVEPVFEAFTKETGINVNVSFLSKGLVEKLVAEGSRSPADLVMTVDISRLDAIVQAGVTQPVQSQILNDNVPAEFRDPDGHWFGLTSRARVIYASKDRVAEGEVTTYEDLASDKWKGRVCTRSGTHAYNLALLSGVIAHVGEENAENWLAGVKSNLARRPQGNDRAQIKAIFAGECDISVGNTYYMGEMLKDPEQKPWADSVRIVFPTFENGGTHMNISGVALTKAAPNKENALKLMEFLASGSSQAIYAEINNKYPLKPGTPTSALVASWGTFTPDDKSLTELAKLRPTSLKITERVNFDE